MKDLSKRKLDLEQIYFGAKTKAGSEAMVSVAEIRRLYVESLKLTQTNPQPSE